jgi:O-antigen/teichoic acid export membrane protein
MMQAMLRKIRLLADRQASLSVSYLLYTVALGFSGLIQLGLLFLLARKLPAPEFGVVALLMIAIPLVSRFVTLGSDIGLAIRIWKRPREEQQADLNAMLAWTAANTAAMVLAATLV